MFVKYDKIMHQISNCSILRLEALE